MAKLLSANDFCLVHAEHHGYDWDWVQQELNQGLNLYDVFIELDYPITLHKDSGIIYKSLIRWHAKYTKYTDIFKFEEDEDNDMYSIINVKLKNLRVELQDGLGIWQKHWMF